MIKISKADLEIDIKNGMKKDQLLSKYSTDTIKLTNSDMTKILKQTGLKIRKFQKPKFQIIDQAPLPGDIQENQDIIGEASKGNSILAE